MERQLHSSLDEVRQDLLRMGAEVEGMIVECMRSLAERDSDLADGVRRADAEVDRLEKVIDESCSRILATQQPTAVDLRFLVAVMKITNDLERIGDCTVNIAKSAKKINAEPRLEPYSEVEEMAELAGRQVHNSLDAFVRKDSEAALEVCVRDRKIDQLYKRVFRDMTSVMTEQPEAVSPAIHLLLVARNFERIGDHSTNIAEDVVYFIEGRDIRHPSLEEPTPATTPSN